MQQHFQHCIVLLLGGASVRTALSNISNAPSKTRRTGKKRGRKSPDEKEDHDKMIKIMAIGLFSDSRCRTIHGYLLAHDMDFLYDSL